MSAEAAPARPVSPELCFRFPCARCRALLSVPVAQLEADLQECPRCATPIDPPGLGRETAGVEQILRLFPTKVDLACPKCGCKLGGTAEQLGKRRRCRNCRTWLSLVLAADTASETEAPSATRKRKPANDRPERRQPAPQASTRREPRPVEERRSRREPPQTVAPVPPARSRRMPEPVEPVIHDDDPPPLVYHGNCRGNETASSGRGGPSLLSSPRGVFWCIYLTLQFGPFVLFVLLVMAGDVESAGIVGAICCPWLLFGWIPSRFIARTVTPLLVSTFHCPHCHEEYEMIGRWSCGCGFTDHRDRHLLRFRCPKCSGALGYYDCDRCGSTIMLRTRFG